MKARVLFYCQHLLGIGHLTRSLAICDALCDVFDVHFIQGGPDIGKTLNKKSSFHHHFLSPLLMREHDSSLYDPVGLRSPEEILQERDRQIADILSDGGFKALVTELFPFGRNKFRSEILKLVGRVRAQDPNAIVATSVRDILVNPSESIERDIKFAKTSAENYDLVFVHSDSAVLPLERSFSQVDLIRHQLIYTGFVTETALAAPLSIAERRNEVIVSMGGGSVGQEMLRAVRNVVSDFPQFCFRFVTGPYAPKELAGELAVDLPRHATVERFLPDFENQMGHARLSISLGGYNTMMNVLNSRTPALVYPYMANIEQDLRAREMQRRGYVGVFYEHDLSANKLSALIQQRLQAPWPSGTVALNGARQMAEILRLRLQERP